MATFVAHSSVNMAGNTGLAVLDSEVALVDILSIESSVSGSNVVLNWPIAPYGTVNASFDVAAEAGESSFSATVSFDSLALSNGSALWTLTNIPLSATVSGDFDTGYTSVSIPGAMSMSFNFYSFSGIEDISITENAGFVNFAQFVLRQADSITGSGSNDTLRGYNGNDTILGKVGNDYLYGGGGADRVEGGDGSDYLYGDAANDVLLGGAAIDRLYGGDANDQLKGGAGSDTLSGGNGADKFFFDYGLNGSTNKDLILDFNHGAGDKIVLDKTIFTKLSVVGTGIGDHYDASSGDGGHGKDGNDWINYNPTTGVLSYDADGSGGAYGMVAFAQLGSSNHPSTLVATGSNADFIVVA